MSLLTSVEMHALVNVVRVFVVLYILKFLSRLTLRKIFCIHVRSTRTTTLLYCMSSEWFTSNFVSHPIFSNFLYA